ncbi:hypothetical protein IWW52_000189 [Coemansia sp. RSA 2704]|nr:hypothetical protein IWW52_000189 [Coemansia sp. RSA 2704]
MAAAASAVRLVGSGQTTHPRFKLRQEVTSGGIGYFDPAPVASGGFGTTGDSTAATQQLSNIVGALLMKNQSQTLCEVAMVTQRFGFVAASCGDYVNGQIDPNVNYGVGLSKNMKDFYANLGVETIIPHPNYNPDTFENNIAVVMFASNPLVTFNNAIADWALDWTNYYFVHRSQAVGNEWPLYSWNEPSVSVTNGTNTINMNLDQCNSASTLYEANQDKFICSPLDLSYYYNRDCSIPYGAVYMGHDNTVAAAAVFSHTSIHGNEGFCGGGKMVNYYVVLRNYIKWAEQVSGQTVNVYHSADPIGYTASSDPNFSMAAPKSPDAADIHIYGYFTMDQVLDNANQTSSAADESSLPVSGVVASSGLDITTVAGVTATLTSTDIATLTSTDITTQSTIEVTTEVVSSTDVITSTTVETSSTTATVTVTEQTIEATTTTDMSTVTVTNNPQNPTATMLITPQFYTQTVTAHDTVTQTVTAGDGAAANAQPPQQNNSQSNAAGAASVVTETETVTVTENSVIIGTPDNIPTGFMITPVVVTETVFSTVSNAASVEVDVETTTETVTETPSASVVTSFVTSLSTQMRTVTSNMVITESASEDEYYETDMPMDVIESSSSSEGIADDNSSPMSKTTIAIIIALVLALLALVGLLYYFCVYRRRKEEEERYKAYMANNLANTTNNRVARWALGNQPDRDTYADRRSYGKKGPYMDRRSYVDSLPDYNTSMKY